jgi:hypothetical protein
MVYRQLDSSPSIFNLIINYALLLTIFGLTIGILVYSSQINEKTDKLLPSVQSYTPACTADIESRRKQAYLIRVHAAEENYLDPIPCPVNNGDESLYSSYIAQFTKGLEHDANGVVLPGKYEQLLNAKTPEDYNNVQRTPGAVLQLKNPQGANAFSLIGADTHALILPPPFTFASKEMAAEYIELAWMALARDIPFSQYGLEPITQAAIVELNALGNAYVGPKPVTAANLFRANYTGNLVGPYLSQFFYLPCLYGANILDQKIVSPVAGVEFLTNFTEFLRVQNGLQPAQSLSYEPVSRFMINGRDIAHYVHIDALYQAYHVATMILLGMNAPVSDTNPYKNVQNQCGFATFGGPNILSMVTEVADRALSTVWHSKWNIHRKLRPEAFGGFVDRHKKGFLSSPIHSSLLTSTAVNRLNITHGSYLLPIAVPEGSPLHPSYGSGHATVSAACVTILKAWFQEDWVIPNPLQPNLSGSTLTPYLSANLTVLGELQKISANVGIGRSHLGVHYRSDYDASVKLGEDVAIRTLRDVKRKYFENFSGWKLTKFDGDTIFI